MKNKKRNILITVCVSLSLVCVVCVVSFMYFVRVKKDIEKDFENFVSERSSEQNLNDTEDSDSIEEPIIYDDTEILEPSTENSEEIQKLKESLEEDIGGCDLNNYTTLGLIQLINNTGVTVEDNGSTGTFLYYMELTLNYYYENGYLVATTYTVEDLTDFSNNTVDVVYVLKDDINNEYVFTYSTVWNKATITLR